MTEASVESQVIRNSAAQFVARALELGSMFVITAAIARYWGTRALGGFSVITTFAALFAFAADWGVNLLLMREVALRREQAARYLGGALLWVLWCSPVATLMIVAAARGLGYGADLQLGILLGALWMIFGAFVQIFRATVYAFERSETDIPVVLVERGLAIGLGLVVIAGGRGLHALLGALILSRAVALCAIAVLYFRRISRDRVVLDPALASSLGRAALPFGLNVLGTMIYVQSDVVLLSMFRPLEEVGLYRAAGAVAVPLSTLGLVMSTAQLPTIVRALHTGRGDQAGELQFNMLRYATIIGLPLAAMLLVVADRIIFTVYGSGFGPSALVLRLLAFVVPLRLLNGILGAALTAGGLQSVRTRIVWVAAAANVLLNLVAIPWWGMIGASATTVLTDALIAVLLYMRASRIIRLPTSGRAFASPLACAAIPGATLVLMRNLPLGVALFAACAAYLGTLFVTGGATADDFDRLTAGVRGLSADLFGVRQRKPGT